MSIFGQDTDRHRFLAITRAFERSRPMVFPQQRARTQHQQQDAFIVSPGFLWRNEWIPFSGLSTYQVTNQFGGSNKRIMENERCELQVFT